MLWYEDGRAILYEAEAIKRPDMCKSPSCLHSIKPHIHSSKINSLRDIKSEGKLVFINLKICRYRCPDCNYVFPDEFSFFAKNSHITNRLKDEFVNRVTMDFAPAYARCVRDILPDSLIVIDKFHAVQKVNRCLDRTRIYLQNYYHGECGADTRRFKRAKYLFMTNWEDLSKEGTDRFDPKTAVFICADGSIKSFSDKAKGLYKAPEPSKLESKSIKKGVVSFGMATSYSDFSGIIPKIDSRRITKY